MHVKGFLHKLLSLVMHKKRLDTLIHLVTGLLTHKKLSVTGLGRSIHLPIQERSGIKRADRFIGNQKLNHEVIKIYHQNVKVMVGNKLRPKIIADWSHIPNTTHYLLRAALATQGRAITLYEEVHEKEKLSNVKIETTFLTTLSKLLPVGCRPILITDAGFRNPWFKQILKLRWDYVGRIRGLHTYYDGVKWQKCKDLYLKAKSVVCEIGEVFLCKRNGMLTNLFLIKESSKNRYTKKKYRHNQGGNDRVHYCRSAKEPWLLASSLSKGSKVIKLYKMRMQIEEGFRDLKSSRYGFGLRHAYSKEINRIKILLLIAMLACLIAWLVGMIAEKNHWQYHFQANSIKHKRVLSLFYLGCQVIKRNLSMGGFKQVYDLNQLRKFIT